LLNVIQQGYVKAAELVVYLYKHIIDNYHYAGPYLSPVLAFTGLYWPIADLDSHPPPPTLRQSHAISDELLTPPESSGILPLQPSLKDAEPEE
jgi:hypothetical protein